MLESTDINKVQDSLSNIRQCLKFKLNKIPSDNYINKKVIYIKIFQKIVFYHNKYKDNYNLGRYFDSRENYGEVWEWRIVGYSRYSSYDEVKPQYRIWQTFCVHLYHVFISITSTKTLYSACFYAHIANIIIIIIIIINVA